MTLLGEALEAIYRNRKSFRTVRASGVAGDEARRLWVERPARLPPRPTVRLSREGTQVELEGSGMSLEELVELAGTLVPLAPWDYP